MPLPPVRMMDTVVRMMVRVVQQTDDGEYE
jgi:hypothetical protein